MKGFRLYYIFESENGVIPRLKNKKKIGHFTFSPGSKEIKGFKVSFLVKAKDISEATKNGTADELADIISTLDVYGLQAVLLSGEQTRWEQKNGDRTKEATTQFRIHADIAKKIEPHILKKSLVFLKKLNRFSPKKRQVIRRSLHYYGRGRRDRDPIDAFIDFWNSLEILSMLYSGKVEPAKCVKCGHVFDPKPIGGTLRAMFRKLGLNEYLETLNQLFEERSKIIHPRSNESKNPSTKKLEELVKIMFEKIVT